MSHLASASRPNSARWVSWILLLAAASGCTSTPWGKCEPCVSPCDVAPACWGYFPTCWRPWPCPDPCPIYDWDAGYEPPADEFVPGPDPIPPAAEVDTSFRHQDLPEFHQEEFYQEEFYQEEFHQEEFPTLTEPMDHSSPLIPTIDPNLTDTALLGPQLQPLFRPLPKTIEEEAGVVRADWPASATPESRVILTGAQTPSSPRALSTVEFVQ